MEKKMIKIGFGPGREKDNFKYENCISSGLRNYYGEVNVSTDDNEKFYMWSAEFNGENLIEISQEFYEAFKREFSGRFSA